LRLLHGISLRLHRLLHGLAVHRLLHWLRPLLLRLAITHGLLHRLCVAHRLLHRLCISHRLHWLAVAHGLLHGLCVAHWLSPLCLLLGNSKAHSRRTGSGNESMWLLLNSDGSGMGLCILGLLLDGNLRSANLDSHSVWLPVAS
jgi:hypothetical protein